MDEIINKWETYGFLDGIAFGDTKLNAIKNLEFLMQLLEKDNKYSDNTMIFAILIGMYRCLPSLNLTYEYVIGILNRLVDILESESYKTLFREREDWRNGGIDVEAEMCHKFTEDEVKRILNK